MDIKGTGNAIGNSPIIARSANYEEFTDKSVLVSLTKSVLVSLRLTSSVSATDAGIYTKVLGSIVT